MPFSQRIRYASFIENQRAIEGRWDKQFGDRQNELVIIGQDLDAEQVSQELQDCLCTEPELNHLAVGGWFNDPFPVWE